MEKEMFSGNSLQIGFFNAWLGTVLAWLHLMFLVAINKAALKRLNDMSWYNNRDKMASLGTFVFMVVILVYSIWVPLKLGTIWFYIGLSIYSLGTFLNIIALYNYATTPEDEPIVSGLYKYSRNPLYVCWAVMLLGICIATKSIGLFLLFILYSIPTHLLILGEERYCLEEYGNPYKRYMTKVPRYLLFF